MTIVQTHLHCPYCGKGFDLELEENMREDDLIEECPLCGSPVEIRLVLGEDDKLLRAEAHRVDGDSDD